MVQTTDYEVCPYCRKVQSLKPQSYSTNPQSEIPNTKRVTLRMWNILQFLGNNHINSL